MPQIYFTKEEMRLMYDLLDSGTALGQGDYTDDEWETLNILFTRFPSQ